MPPGDRADIGAARLDMAALAGALDYWLSAAADAVVGGERSHAADAISAAQSKLRELVAVVRYRL